MKNFEVSVITPFHNVDMDMFQKCFESMKAQLYGFEKIEWIIVLHNCDKEHISAVHSLCDEYDNIILDELNNEIHTPSCPRNRGLKLANGKYIGFLDGDDRYTPECIKEVLKYMVKNEADITWFRREYILEDMNSLPITEIVLWSQTKKEIIITKDNWDGEKMFSGICGMVTSRMYDRAFLEEHNISFDESVPFAEDYLFNIEAYGHAEKICYLPQTIGYTYYINNSSMVQSQNKDGATLISYAKGYKKLFDRGLMYGFFMNAIMSRLLVVLCRFMTASSSLTLDDRKEIRDILAPYVFMIKPLKVSKIYSEMVVRESYEVPRDVILNVEKWDQKSDDDDFLSGSDLYNKFSLQQLALRVVIENNISTDIGREYDFKSIYTISGYRNRMPLTDYEYYRPLIDLNTRIGESEIFVKEPITNYVYSKGHSERRRLYPCTQSFIEDYEKEFAKLLKGHRNFLAIEIASKQEEYNDRTSVASIYAMMIQEYVKNMRSGKHPDSTIVNDDFMLFNEKSTEIRYQRILTALADANITQLYAPNVWILLVTLKFIKSYRKKLVKDLREGRIFVSEKNDRVVSRAIKADPERADIVESALLEEGELHLKRIWPGLTRVVSLGSGEYSAYADIVKEKNTDIAFNNGCLFMPELVLGRAVADGTDEYMLILGRAFLEFSRYDAGTGTYEEDVILTKDLKEGDIVKVFVSNKAGLYRFDCNKLIRISRIEGDNIYFYQCDELRHAVIVKGIKVNRLEIGSAIKSAFKETEIKLFNYAFAVFGNHLKIYLEPFSEEMVENADILGLTEKLDEGIAKINPLYKEKRNRGIIAEPEVKFVGPDASLLYAESLSRKLHMTMDMIKPVHELWMPSDIKFFEANLL